MQRRYYNLVSTHEVTKTLYVELIPEYMNGKRNESANTWCRMCINLQPCTYMCVATHKIQGKQNGLFHHVVKYNDRVH